jgi:hypothetical protein
MRANWRPARLLVWGDVWAPTTLLRRGRWGHVTILGGLLGWRQRRMWANWRSTRLLVWGDVWAPMTLPRRGRWGHVTILDWLLGRRQRRMRLIGDRLGYLFGGTFGHRRPCLGGGVGVM